MKTYCVTNIGSTYVTKNSLEREVFLMLQENSGKAFTGERLEAFKLSVLQKIADLNVQHKRCKPIRADWGVHHNKINNQRKAVHYTLYLNGICDFRIFIGETEC